MATVADVMGRVLLASLLLIVSSCGVAGAPGVSPVAATVSPSQSPAATSQPPPRPTRSTVLAVTAEPVNSLHLAASDGSVLASTVFTPAPFRADPWMSWTSASITRVYFLDGGSEVRYLQPDGSSGVATRIAVGPGEQAGFSVSPDDRRIAVSVFTYSLVPKLAYKGMRMYVENLQGGGDHLDIYSSPAVAEFPIGWTGGHLVIAVTTPMCCQTLPLNPYAASVYHVVNPDTGDRITSLCDNSYGPSGPVEPIGTMCIEHQGGPTFVHWDGSHFPPPSAVQVSFQYLNALSPDGLQAATGGNPVRILTRDDDRLPVSGSVFGWLDASHVVIKRDGAATLSVFDLSSRFSAEVPGPIYLGTLPAAIS